MLEQGLDYIHESEDDFGEKLYLVDVGTDREGEHMIIVSEMRSRHIETDLHEIFGEESPEHLDTVRIAKEPDIFNYRRHRILGNYGRLSFFDLREEEREDYRQDNGYYESDSDALEEFRGLLTN